MTPLLIRIPGEPVAQGRGRVVTHGRFPRVIDPAKSRNWKAYAATFMQSACPAPLPRGPLAVEIIAVWPCPKSREKKRTPAPEGWKTSRPDCDNVAKAVLDALQSAGVMLDDSDVCLLTVRKRIAAQGAAPMVLVKVEGLEE